MLPPLGLGIFDWELQTVLQVYRIRIEEVVGSAQTLLKMQRETDCMLVKRFHFWSQRQSHYRTTV